MKKIFFIYWVWYIIWEYIKILEWKAPMWLAENVSRLDYANMFFIPVAYMFLDWVMQERKSYRFMFYCSASFLARIATFMIAINSHDPNGSAYRSTTTQYIYGIVFLMAILLEKPFISKYDNEDNVYRAKFRE